ncbi:MAG: hypothetical protein ACYC09_08015 [Bacteroidota bacterium]
MKKIISIIAAAVFLYGIPAEVFAAGTPAGTVIQSRSRAVYTTASGTISDTVYSTVVSITVRQVASFNLIPANSAANSQSDSTVVDYPAVITNSGNGTDVGRLTSSSSKGWTTELYADVNGDGVLQPEEKSAGTISQTPPIAADAAFRCVVRIYVPRDESLVGDKDTTRIAITSDFDAAKSSYGDIVTTVQSANLSSFKNGLTVSNPAPNAGTAVIYTLVFTNNGSRTAENVTIQNIVPNGLTIISSSGSQGVINNSSVPNTWTVGTMSASAAVTLTVTALVSETIPPGIIIDNQMIVNYSVGVNSYTLSSNIVQVIVGGMLSYGVQVTPYALQMERESGDTAVYRLNIRNIGSFTDVIELNHTSSGNLSWTYFKDANDNQSLDASDPVLMNTNASGGADTDSLVSGDSLRVFVRTIIPRVQNDLRNDSLLVVGTSAGDPSKSDSSVHITTLLAPMVSLSKDIFPIGDQPAGSVMTYTITYANNGSVSVNNFSVIDVTPSSTEYIPHSVKLNGLSISDNTGAVSVVEDQSNNKIITVSIGALNAQTTGSVEFKVKIK